MDGGGIEISHGFYETKLGVRYTIDLNSQWKILDALLQLNHVRYLAEVEAGLNERLTAKQTLTRDSSTTSFQAGFDFSGEMMGGGQHVFQSVLNWLKANQGWRSKEAIMTATGVADSRWKATIDALLADGRVERQGERRGTRYRATRANQ